MADDGLDLDAVRERFEASADHTIGLEEEFALVDPETLELQHRFEELFERSQRDEVLAGSAAGELIASEIEIRSGKCATFSEAMERQRERRSRLFAIADEMGLALGATGTHPWADYLDQRIIDTPHYTRLQRDLRWVAQRNNSWSLHLHMGIRGADRAIAVCDWMRGLLPALLALSANSPFLDGRDTGLHTVRSEIFTRVFPRCGIPGAFESWDRYRDYVEMLRRTGTIVESTQLWWSIRPHHFFGTVEVRICDAQTRGDESFALAGLIAGCIAQIAADLDARGYSQSERLLLDREIEENFWRAIRYGMDGKLIDFRRGEEIAARAAIDELLEWSAPARARLGIELALPELNGAQRARAALGQGQSIEEIYRDAVSETRRTYLAEEVVG